MKKTIALISAALILGLSSCSKKSPDFVNSIPDDAVGVMALHPMQLHSKGKVASFESVRNMVKTEIWKQVLENPLSSGLMLNEYSFAWISMEESSPVIGMVCGMRDAGKFENMLKRVDADVAAAAESGEHYTKLLMEDHGLMAWNDERLVVLALPDDSEGAIDLEARLDWHFKPVREESLTSMVDFRDFLGKMKDLNFWVSSNEIFDLVKQFAGDELPELPFDLYNNFAQVFFEFSDGRLEMHSETHYSEEVEKTIGEFLVMKPSVNQSLMELAPGENLLMALTAAMDLEKALKMFNEYMPQTTEMDSISSQLEQATGMDLEALMNSVTGDIAVSICGLEGESMIPVEIFIGVGVNGTALREKLKETAQGALPVEDEGDFFLINLQGNEIYCGILQDILVLTNIKGYKDKVADGSMDKSLASSAFEPFAGQSMGMYVNLDLDEYPSLIQDALSQNAGTMAMLDRFADPFDHLGVSNNNSEGRFVIETSRPSENSLYTLLKLTEEAAD